MLVVLPPNIIYGYNFVAPLRSDNLLTGYEPLSY